MALVTWDQTYSVKVSSCDAEHQKLFDLINKLHDAMKAGQGRAILSDIVRELEKYTQTHFLAEEALLQKTNYPRLTEQRLQHQKFVAEVRKFRENVQKGVGGDSIAVLTFLKDWLSKHIKQTDMLYAQHLNSAGIR